MVVLPCDQEPVVDVAMRIRHVCLLLIMSPFPIHDELILQPTPNAQGLNTIHLEDSKTSKTSKTDNLPQVSRQVETSNWNKL